MLYSAFYLPLDSCASQPHLAPCALRTRRTRLRLWSLSTSDPPELLRSSGCLTLDPLNSSRNSFHPCLASVPVAGPANVHQTGSQPACQTRHLVPPLAARSDSGRSYVRDNYPDLIAKVPSSSSFQWPPPPSSSDIVFLAISSDKCHPAMPLSSFSNSVMTLPEGTNL